LPDVLMTLRHALAAASQLITPRCRHYCRHCHATILPDIFSDATPVDIDKAFRQFLSDEHYAIADITGLSKDIFSHCADSFFRRMPSASHYAD